MKPSIPWKKQLGISREENDHEKNSEFGNSAVSEGVTRTEYAKRYQNLVVTLYLQMFFVLASLGFLLVFASSFMQFTIGILVLAIYSMVYLRTAFTAWASRRIWEKWQHRNEPSPYTPRHFFGAVEMSPREILPLSLPPVDSATEKETR